MTPIFCHYFEAGAGSCSASFFMKMSRQSKMQSGNKYITTADVALTRPKKELLGDKTSERHSTACNIWQESHGRHLPDCSSSVHQRDSDPLFSFTALSQSEDTYFLFSTVAAASCLVVSKVDHKLFYKQTFWVQNNVKITSCNHI